MVSAGERYNSNNNNNSSSNNNNKKKTKKKQQQTKTKKTPPNLNYKSLVQFDRHRLTFPSLALRGLKMH